MFLFWKVSTLYLRASRRSALNLKNRVSGKFLQWFLQFWCLNWFGLLPIYNAVWCAIFTLEKITVDSWASSISSILREEMIHIRTKAKIFRTETSFSTSLLPKHWHPRCPEIAKLMRSHSNSSFNETARGIRISTPGYFMLITILSTLHMVMEYENEFYSSKLNFCKAPSIFNKMYSDFVISHLARCAVLAPTAFVSL